jgi:hypothetical protein
MGLAIVQEGRSPAARVISDLWALDFDDFGTQIAERLTRVCYGLIQSIAAARQRMPMKLEAVFS